MSSPHPSRANSPITVHRKRKGVKAVVSEDLKIAGFFALIIGLVVLVGLIGPYMQTREPEYERIEFICEEHNFTLVDMEVMTRYVCWENQTCISYMDGNGNGIWYTLTECIRSVAYFDENASIRCEGTVDHCNNLYNIEGGKEL
jgi:hypothetical protein